MKIIPKIKVLAIAGLLALFTGLNAFGAASIFNTVSTGASGSNIISGAGSISKLVLNSTAGTCVFTIFDAPSTNTTYVIGAYTNVTPTLRTNVVTYTDILGNTVSNSFTYVTNVSATVGQSTNNYRQLGQYSVAAGQSLTLNYDTAYPFVFGAYVTNSASSTGAVTITYQPWK